MLRGLIAAGFYLLAAGAFSAPLLAAPAAITLAAPLPPASPLAPARPLPSAPPRVGRLPPPVPLSLPVLRSPLPPDSALPPPIPLTQEAADRETDALRRAMAEQVPGLLHLSHARLAGIENLARAMLTATGTTLDAPQLMLVVDRNPAAQVMLLLAAGPGPWSPIGAVHVSTGQAGRKDYYITPVGVFSHSAAILDFRAAGTYNEHHVRGLGLAGMRVWDFGWQWALKGWHRDFAGGDIRLQMHATDPDLLERKLGHPASEGCVRVASAMNRFLDRRGVLDADDRRAAASDTRYRALLAPDPQPSPLAGRLLVVVDSRLPPGTPPTAASRPVDWPAPPALAPQMAVQE